MALEEAIQHCKEIANGNCACADDHRQLAEWLTELAEKRKAEPQWIPCSDRLPEEDKEVLLSVDCEGSPYIGIGSYWGDGYWMSSFDDPKRAYHTHTVIAWMPLPEPYKGEQE